MEKVIKIKIGKDLKKGEVRTMAVDAYKDKLKADTSHLIKGETKTRFITTNKYFIFIDGPKYSDLLIGDKGVLRSRTEKEWGYFFREYICEHPTKLNKRNINLK